MFYPVPNVDSCILKIEIDKNKFDISNWNEFSKLVQNSCNIKNSPCNARGGGYKVFQWFPISLFFFTGCRSNLTRKRVWLFSSCHSKPAMARHRFGCRNDSIFMTAGILLMRLNSFVNTFFMVFNSCLYLFFSSLDPIYPLYRDFCSESKT